MLPACLRKRPPARRGLPPQAAGLLAELPPAIRAAMWPHSCHAAFVLAAVLTRIAPERACRYQSGTKNEQRTIASKPLAMRQALSFLLQERLQTKAHADARMRI